MTRNGEIPFNEVGRRRPTDSTVLGIVFMGVHYNCELSLPIFSLIVLKFSKVYRKQEWIASHLDDRVSPSFVDSTRPWEEGEDTP